MNRLRRYAALMRRRAAEGHASVPRQLFELLYLRLRNGVLTGTYFTAGLYRSSLTWAEKKAWVFGRVYNRAVDRCNDPDYQFAVLHKLITDGLLKSFGIPSPVFLGVVNRIDGQTRDGEPLRTPEDLERMIRREAIDEIAIKPLGSWGGKGFLKLRLRRRDTVSTSLWNEDHFVPLSELWASRLYPDDGPAYLCQKVVHQHPEVAAIHPESINTARVWMCQPERGRWVVHGALLRMGVGAMLVDNVSSGGVTSRIDVATGTLSPIMLRGLEREWIDTHPTTGAPVAGVTLPMWDRVVELCLRTGRAFSHLRLMALDVAFTPDGPLIIEVESQPGEAAQLAFDRGVGPLLKELAAAGPIDWRS